MNLERKKIGLMLALIISTFCGCQNDWKSAFDTQLAELGHRNWIVVADSAYPSQNSKGITTLVTGESQTEVLTYVLQQIELSPHVRPKIMFDQELAFVTDQDALGVGSYKEDLKRLLGSREASEMSHEQIIEQLDRASEMYKLLIIKTNMTIPYTSVFINLDCDYWSEGKEQRLRSVMGKAE